MSLFPLTACGKVVRVNGRLNVWLDRCEPARFATACLFCPILWATAVAGPPWVPVAVRLACLAAVLGFLVARTVYICGPARNVRGR